MYRRSTLAAIAILTTVPLEVLAQSAPKPGAFGFTVTVDSEGFFLNPTLKSVTVKSVVPGHPAAAAGVHIGDQVMEVEGRQIAGAKARDIQALMKKNVGESLSLKLRRPGGELYAVSLVAVPKDK